MKTVPNHKIILTFDAQGNPQAEVQGIKGEGCDGILSILDELGTITEDEKTPDHEKPDDVKVTPGRRKVHIS